MPSSSLVAKLAAVWFTPAPAARLGLLRILIGGWAHQVTVPALEKHRNENSR